MFAAESMDASQTDDVHRGLSGRGVVVELLDASGKVPEADGVWLHEHAVASVRALGATGLVSVKIVGDGEMAEAHERWLETPGTTDVITFDLGSDPAATPAHIEADLLVCVDEAARQAKARGHTVRQELLLYVLHGLLHCLGHDDHDDAAFARMHAEEDRVLVAIGVGATFGRADGSKEGAS